MAAPSEIMRVYQKRLVELGFFLPKFGADGFGGRETQEAILSLQRKYKLKLTGQFDSETVSFMWPTSKPQILTTLENPLVQFGLNYIVNQIKEFPIMQALSGYKTYIFIGLAAVVIIINHFFGPIPGLGLDPNAWIAELGALVPVGTIRAAIAKGPKE